KECGNVVVYGSLQDNSVEPIGEAFLYNIGLSSRRTQVCLAQLPPQVRAEWRVVNRRGVCPPIAE
ncbi:MAG TPA: hypothetical protein VK603_18265, partial [Candidatus Saccharimonadales bacterium]|nr:hypothetical protein [Candidatus Saccharimonadales bacterium]